MKEGISPDKYFVLYSGGLIKDIKELAFALDYMSDEEFSFHVNDEKNDFSKWIKDVFGDEELAKKLMRTTDKKETQLIILKHLIEQRW